MNPIYCLLVALLFTSAALADILVAEEKVDSEYIIVFKNSVSSERFPSVVKLLRTNFSSEDVLIRNWEIGTSFKAAHAKLAKRTLSYVLKNPDVDFVEENGEVHAWDCDTQQDVEWNLARVNERYLDLIDTEYVYDHDGAGVDVYIIDTGVLTTHVEFGGRATWGTNTIDNINEDCNGHGTHVAGTVAGNLYGLAKNTNIIGVKCLNCGGSGSWASVISAIEWVVKQYTITRRPSLANMSLGGAASASVNRAVDAAVDAGVTMIAAAGNSNGDACNFSPAGAPKAISVVATTVVQNPDGTEKDRRASFSNWGRCTHISAPGQLIKAAWRNSPGQPPNQSYNTISGTSMAAPHIAGAAAILLSSNPSLTPSLLKAALVSEATDGVIDMGCTNPNCQLTPNKLVYTHCGVDK